jgi:glycosyltransferase involved in cell wall biosynthesis
VGTPTVRHPRLEADVPVLLVGNFLASCTGSRFVCEDLAERLGASGRPVTTTSARTRRAGRLVDMVATAWRARARYRVAVVDVFSGASFIWAEAVTETLRSLGKPYALVLRGGDLPAFAARWPGRVRRLLQRADAVTTPSRYLLEHMGPLRGDVELIPNPLDLSQHGYVRRMEAHPRLVWLRAFHEVYNPSLAPRVLALLADEFPSISLIMVGRDKGDGSLQRMRDTAAQLGVLDRIGLPGGVPKGDVPRWLARGDIFLNTTDVDNTPVSVLEAMASGLCVVTTDVGGIPYLVRHEHDALLVHPGDDVAMAAGVRRVLTEPALCARLSANARRTAECSDWSAVLPLWDELLDRLGARGAASRSPGSAHPMSDRRLPVVPGERR